MTKSTSLCLYICSVWKLVMRKLMSYPSRGFLRRMKKCSALIITKLMNFLHKIFSSSSACLMAMDTRIELTDPSIKALSFSFRLTITGVRSNSLLLLTSTSGLLWRSTTCDSKFSRHMVAVSVERTAVRYGFNETAILSVVAFGSI